MSDIQIKAPSAPNSPYFTVTCETEDAVIRYTTNGSDPDESSDTIETAFPYKSIVAGTAVTLKARAYKDGYEPSDIASCTYTPVTVPMSLPDGSVLFYDRGNGYGEYCIGAYGYPVRLSGGEDDGSSGSTLWRYLICDRADLDMGTKKWGVYGTDYGLTNTIEVGYGLPNTEAMLAKYADNDTYWWKLIKEKRDNTGLNWFMPSKNELDMLYDNKNAISSLGGIAFQSGIYCSSSEYSDTSIWRQYLTDGIQNTSTKDSNFRCRLIRRI